MDLKKNKYQTFNIEKEYQNLRLDKFLFSIFPNVNNVTIQKAIRNKDILIDGKNVKSSNQILKCNNTLQLSNFILKIFNSPPQIIKTKKELKFTDKEIDKILNCVIYKDENLIAINKPNSLAVQSGTKIEKSLNDYLPYLKFENNETPKLVHRLDKDTSGVILLARNKLTSEILSEYFKNKIDKLEKKYITLVLGKLNSNSGVIDIPLIKKVENGIEKVYRDKNGKQATTIYKVIDYNEKYNITLLEVNILTGRTHQIRVHMKEIGHPILGDGKYGSKKAFVDELNVNKMFLHSYEIKIIDFFGKNLIIKADLPNNFIDIFKKLGFKYDN